MTESPLAVLSEAQINEIAQAVATKIAAAPTALTQREAWIYCRLAQSSWFRLKSAGKLPPPVKLPGCEERWLRKDLDEWLARYRSGRRR